jgi:FMN phosphatase YigB (HAD superfamily)
VTPEAEPPQAEAVLFALEEVLVPFQSVRSWQWAWRPQGPVLGERHAQTVLRRGRRAWDRRRWLGLTGKAPPADAGALAEQLAETLRALAGHGLPAAETEAVVRRIQHPTGEVERFPDVAPALARLAAAGVRTGAVSCLSTENARWALRRTGLAETLLLAAGDPPGPAPPDPSAVLAAVARLGAPVDRTVLVGGLYWSDVRGAHRAGLRSVLVDRAGAWPHVQAGRRPSLDGLEEALRAPAPPAPGGGEGPENDDGPVSAP